MLGTMSVDFPTVIPLTAHNFLVINDVEEGPSGRTDALVKTIVATNPAVAVPWSTALQTETIQAEANAYQNAVTSSSTRSFITVTSPNGGENWAEGSTHNITWTSSGLSISDNVSIELSGINDNPMAEFPWESSNSTILLGSGSYSWTIPVNLTSGQYKIRVLDLNTTDKPTIYDDSENYFTITN